jgi:hypothetical protein
MTANATRCNNTPQGKRRPDTHPKPRAELFRSFRPLLQRNIHRLNGRHPFGDLALHEHGHFLRRHRLGLDGVPRQPIADFRRIRVETAADAAMLDLGSRTADLGGSAKTQAFTMAVIRAKRE